MSDQYFIIQYSSIYSDSVAVVDSGLTQTLVRVDLLRLRGGQT